MFISRFKKFRVHDVMPSLQTAPVFAVNIIAAAMSDVTVQWDARMSLVNLKVALAMPCYQIDCTHALGAFAQQSCDHPVGKFQPVES